MKVYIQIYSFYKLKFLIKFKTKNILKIIIIIKKKTFNYFNHKKILFCNNYYKKKKLIMIIHFCNFIFFNHSIKHFLKINHNSIIENKINDIF
ncbi:hypothetical protein CUN91_01115 [Candidatus Carsonella ruddii]|uniref:Uncharacterized protein n=1 Tax=Carsonella ruddii TaxID=114186 RepID=A0A2K8K9K8_CARRU|nr:hypothetical protein [Candidatus Carsonella ruddii]ATX33543.1 hypothetical protein CUN91_01115 [Candidatus Carsonella ruddii]